ncbi:MAG: LamG-like jellyroll fold domain-containing protein [Planctomycetota bacterium]
MMMRFERKAIVCAMALAVGLAVGVAFGADTLRYPVYYLERAPEVDGKVEGDAAWAGAARGVGFHALGGRRRIEKETSFRIGFTEEALYVAFVCSEPEIAKVEAGSQDGNPAIWKEDGVEVFVLPKDGDAIFQVIANASGARTNYRTPVSDLEMDEQAPLERSRAAAFRGKDFYSVEVEIAFTTLGRKPGDGEVWRGNFCRNVNLGEGHKDENFSWAHTVRRYCEPERFAELVFQRARTAGAGETVDALASKGDDAELHLVVSLALDEGYGEVAHGQSAIINDGKIVGAGWTQGRFGWALEFAKEGDVVEVPHSESLGGITRAFTLECWAYFDLEKLAGKSGTLISKTPVSGFGTGYYMGFSDTGGRSRAISAGVAQGWSQRRFFETDNAIETSGWHHVILAYDGAAAEKNCRLYVDGQMVASFDGPVEKINPNDLALTIGSAPAGWKADLKRMTNTFIGKIDEVKVWDKALSGEEIERLYGSLWAKSKPISPAASEVVQDGKPRFEWLASEDGTGYVYELADVPDFSGGGIVKKALSEARFTVAEALAPGVYYWRIWSTDKSGAPTAASAPRAFLVPWEEAFEEADTTPPVITDVKPVLDTTAESARPEIGARWSDDRGIDTGSARLLLDGDDVTAKATVGAEGISFTLGADLAKGVHKIEVSVRDASGNEGNRVRQAFAVGEPYEVVVEVRADGRTTINGEPFFPIMSYHGGVSSQERVRIGFNSGYGGGGVPTTEEEFAKHVKGMEEMREAGFKYMGSFDNYYSRNEREKIEAAIPFLDRDTTFLAYALDEPNGNPKGIEWARHLYASVAAKGHRRPVVHILNNPGAAAAFAEAGDVIEPDCYPVPNQPIVQVAKFIDHARGQLAGKRPVWFCQQAFDWRVYALAIPEGKTYRDLAKSLQDSGWVFRPTPAETRCMTYLALAHDVQGMLWWSAVANNPGNVVNWPKEWREFCGLVGEVRYLSAMLVAPEAPVEIELAPAGAGAHVKAKSYEGRIYVIAVNPNEELPVAPTFKLPAGTYHTVDVLFENRSMKLGGDSFRDLFAPAAAHVYRVE